MEEIGEFVRDFSDGHCEMRLSSSMEAVFIDGELSFTRWDEGGETKFLCVSPGELVNLLRFLLKVYEIAPAII